MIRQFGFFTPIYRANFAVDNSRLLLVLQVPKSVLPNCEASYLHLTCTYRQPHLVWSHTYTNILHIQHIQHIQTGMLH